VSERPEPTERPKTVPIDPEGPDPVDIPDPMPEDLKRPRADRAVEAADPMEGEAPTG
jgi:hypothetical protein